MAGRTEGFEDHLRALESIVDELDSDQLDLETSMDRYQQGVERLKKCTELLRKARQRVSELVRDAEEPFGEGGGE